MARVKKGDKISVISGKDKGKTGEVVQIMPAKNKAIVKGINVVVKHQKPSTANQQGGRISMEASIDLSKVMPVCPSCGKAVRVGYAVVENKKVRVCSKCKEQF